MQFPNVPLLNPAGLWAFIALIPFILIYLRRPKAIDKVIPSLMFLMKEHKVSKKLSFLRTLLKNLLFFLQLIILSALAFSVAQPYLEMPYNITAKGEVVIIDNSASSQAKIDGMTRFEKSLQTAKEHLDGKTSIILAGNMPRTALESGSSREASELLKTLRASDTSTNIGDAIIQAGEMLKDKGEITVISDFITTHGIDPLVAKRKVAASGISVSFQSVWSDAENIGIINARIGKHETKAYVKNFNEASRSVTLNLIQNRTIIRKFELRIAPKSTEAVSFETPAGISRLEIEQADDFMVDNALYISTPPEMKIKALLLTNLLGTHLQIALSSSNNIELDVIEPPSLIPDKMYDAIITTKLNPTSLLPGTFSGDIAKRVRNGTVLVVAAHQYLMSYMPKELLPVEVQNLSGTTQPNVKVFNRFTTDIEFKPTEKHFPTRSSTNATLTLVATSDNRPLIAVGPLGNGTVVFYGIFDEYSEFKNSPSYPIFWDSLITTLVNKGEMESYNKLLDELPTMTEIGVFESEGKKVAVNFLNEMESDVSKETARFEEEDRGLVLERIERKLKIDIELYLIMAAAAILVTELLVVKARGDA